MITVSIVAVMIDRERRLRVYPEISDVDGYAYIYRDASGVRWDVEDQCLYSQEPEKLTYQDWFDIIRSAVMREYGDNLVLTNYTEWKNVAAEIRADCESRARCGPA